MEKLTIIIPLHNSVAYVSDLIATLEAQTNCNVIFVDDRSTDNTIKTLKEALQKTSIKNKILSSSKRGPGEARNVGINNASTDYICFLDSDDVLNENFSRDIISEMSAEPDIIEALFRQQDETGKTISKSNPTNYLSTKSRISSLIDGNISMVSWGKAYRLEFINKNSIRFPAKIENGEDHIFTLKAYLAAENVVVIPKFLYTWRRRQGSLTRSPLTLKKINDYFNVTEKRIALFNGAENVNQRRALYVKTFKEWLSLRNTLKANADLIQIIKNYLILSYALMRFKKRFPAQGGPGKYVLKMNPELHKTCYQKLI